MSASKGSSAKATAKPIPAKATAKPTPAKAAPPKAPPAKPPVAKAAAMPAKSPPGKGAPAAGSPAKAAAAKATPAKTGTPGRKGRGEGGSDSNLHKRVDSERIALHIAAFEKSGGRVEKLGITRVLQRVDEAPEGAAKPAPASTPPARQRKR